MAEARAILGRLHHVPVGVARQGRGCGEAGQGIDEGGNVAVVGACARPRVDGPDADNDDGHHSALAVAVAIAVIV